MTNDMFLTQKFFFEIPNKIPTQKGYLPISVKQEYEINILFRSTSSAIKIIYHIKKLTLECNMQFHKTEIRFQKIITAFSVRSFPKR